jgi:phosphomannomutase
MPSEPIISVSGLRGIVGESLTPLVARRYVLAFAVGLPKGPIVLTRDGRESGPALAAAIAEAINETGRDVIDAGSAATPTCGILTRSLQAAGGIQISASHNPAEYNGLKLFASTGRILTAAAGQLVIDRYRSGATPTVSNTRGEVRPCDDPTATHLDLVLATVDVPRIRARRFRVLLDSNHGAGAILGRKLLQSLGCDVTILGAEPTGRFAHPPEPTAENLAGVCSQVSAQKADIGFCQDPDADRLAIIDEQGRYLGEEYTLALCLAHVLKLKQGSIVTNCSTSRMAEDLANVHSVRLIRSAVGEANVAEAMLAHGAVFGGEGNGGPIDPRVGYVRDSFVGMANTLDAMASRGLPVSRLADELPRYEIHKTKLTLDPKLLPAAFDKLARHFSDARLDRLDGLRLDWPYKWLLVRGSNTEPIVRIIAEAKTQEDAAKLCAEALKVVSAA